VATAAGPGGTCWTWEINGRRWYYQLTLGLNTGFVTHEGNQPVIYTKSLQDAGMFSEGYEFGYMIGSDENE
jgi:hypothetical protein